LYNYKILKGLAVLSEGVVEIMIKAGIIGATGYTGVELVRLIQNHPDVELSGLVSQSYNGNNYERVYPSSAKFCDRVLEAAAPEELARKSDVVFTALPHGVSMEVVEKISGLGTKVIDLGADYRFDDIDVYEKWYKVEHKTPQLAKEAVYGLPELNRENIRSSRVVGNPGCYPTSIILGLAPLLKNRFINLNSIVCDSKSGVSGGGRGLNIAFHYSECNENFKAYNIGVHRHTPEIEQELSKLAGTDIIVSFTPHLVPMTRGILSTIYASLVKPCSTEEIIELYKDFYRDEFFIRIHPRGQYPQTKWVYSSNFCDIGIAVDPRTNRVVVVSAIDNLVKGASGQAVQNMNIMFGLPEERGLDFMPVFP